MPSISYFYGIAIYIYYNDHNEPHFHADYGGEKATFSIKSGKLLDGNVPPYARKLIKNGILIIKKN